MFTFLITKVSDMAKPRVLSILGQLGAKAERDIENLNYGGCGVFAAQVAAMLQYVDGVENVCVRVGATYGVGGNKNRVDDVLEQSNATRGEIGNILSQNGICNGHLAVQFDYRRVTYHFDSTGCYPARDVDVFSRGPGHTTFYLYKGALTPELAVDYADEVDQWNSSFSRRQIPKLTEIIEEHIGEIAFYEGN